MSTSVEGRWLVPESWLWCYAKDIAKVIGGGTPSTKDETNFSSKGIPWLTPADLSDYNGIYIKAGRRDISEKGFHESSARLLPKGTVLFTSRAPIGYCVIAENPITTNQGFKSLVLESSIDPEYIRHYLLNSKEYAESLASGSTFKELSGRKTEKLKFPLPPLNEQRRIVAKIEELTAHSKRARAALDEVPTLIEQFKQSVLAAAFRGDLTADWREKNPDVEPAEKLLERFIKDREIEYKQQVQNFKSTRTRIPKLPKVSYQEGITLFPDSWITISVESASIFIIDCLHSTPKFVDSGEYCVDTNCIEPFKINWHTARKVTKEDFIKRASRLVPEGGDILFSREGTIGTAVKVPSDKRLCLGQRMMMFRFARHVLPEYAEMYLQSPYFESQYKSLITGTTSPHINIGEIRKLSFLVPPVDEQKQIISITRRYLAVCDSLLAACSHGEVELEQLNQSILAKAFRGELVPQKPNDEPASVLLERIRTEREKLEAAKKKKKRRTKNGPILSGNPEKPQQR